MDSVSPNADIERDRKLVEQAKNDPEAFGVIFDLYYKKILGYALKRVGEAQAAEDITAETFIKALRGLWRYRWQGIPFSAWLYRIAGNEINMYLRKQKRSFSSLELMIEAGFDRADESAAEERAALEALLEDDARMVRVMNALRELPDRYQEIIALRYIEGKELRDIAQIVSKKEGTVRSLLSRGMSMLRDACNESPQQTVSESITTNEGRSVLSVLTRNIL